MNKIYQSISIFLIAGLMLISTTAHALSPGAIDADFVLVSGSYNANFGNNSVSSSPFMDHFTFWANPPIVGGGGFSAISGFNLFGPDVDFSSVKLWNVTDSTLAATANINSGFVAFGSFPALTSGKQYDIVVDGILNSGSSSGSYAGNITVVPEPETWLMLLIGLFVVGFAARFRPIHPEISIA